MTYVTVADVPENVVDNGGDLWLNEDMTTTNPAELVKGETYSAVIGSCGGRIDATYRGRFGSELAFRLANGEHWTVPVAYFREAHPAVVVR